MGAADIHAWLMAAVHGDMCEGFDAHVLASILAVGLADAKERNCLPSETLGVGGARLSHLVAQVFPSVHALFESFESQVEPVLEEDENCLRDLLRRATTGDERELLLADMVARRAMAPNHLWQDLGLRSRRELSWLMERYFEPLASRNTGDMKWKKFLFRMICRDEGFRLCSVPVCSECDDFDDCFGDESGESRMARIRKSAD
ncbi:nitrogen fixation protein NifQ [Acetobacter lambici]|nr:nitrogen fixation protein NifQ [Acetobacter lambici]NHO56029.1 nitrogen fixation protein NifQ [Acetobacter lambici]